MRIYGPLLACLLGLGGSGCTLAQTATRNALLGPCDWWEEHQESNRYDSLAASAWQSAKCSVDSIQLGYADGFRDGYVDFLKRGGNGEPPPLEMIRYARRQSANRCAVEQWVAGFRHGAHEARASGQRWCATKSPMLCGGQGMADPYAKSYCVERLPKVRLDALCLEPVPEPRSLPEPQPVITPSTPNEPAPASARPGIRARIGGVRLEQVDE
ncbi:MAG: hypothetical protein U0744_16625 [Gemmataceae bacterium]